MISVRSSVDIESLAESVFTSLSKLENYPLWQSGMIKVTYDPPVRQGTIARGWTSNFGVEVEVGVEITEFGPPTLMVVESRLGPLKFLLKYILTEARGMTKLTCITEIDTGTTYALAEPIMQDMGQVKLDSDLRSLKILLEKAPSGKI